MLYVMINDALLSLIGLFLVFLVVFLVKTLPVLVRACRIDYDNLEEKGLFVKFVPTKQKNSV